MKKFLLIISALLLTISGAWAIDTKVADYSNVQPWGTSAYISRSNSNCTLTTTDASGLAGLTLTTDGSSSAGYWDRSGNWLLIIPGTNDEVTYTVTITAPTGYDIVGYNMECCSWNVNRTYVVTAADGTTVTTTSTAIQTLNVKNVDASSTTITVKGESTTTNNVWFTIKNMTVALAKKQGTQLNSTADGVTWSAGATSWNNSWSAGTTPNVNLKCTWYDLATALNDFKAATNITGAFYLHTNNTPYYTISVPYNYLIKSYTIVGTANPAVTLTPTSGTADNTSFAANQTKAATVTLTPTTNTATFSLTGSNTTYIDDATIYVEYVTTASQSITDLSNLRSDKAYIITNARATWQFADNATAMTATNSTTNLGAATQQIAIVNKDGKYYLYSVNARKYLTASNTLTASPSEAEPVTITSTGDSNYPWLFQFADNSNGYINIGGNINVAINDWSTPDDGNKNAIIEAADFDPASLPFDVTYTLRYGGATVATATVGAYDGDTPALPTSLDNGLCDYTYDVETLTTSTTAVNVTATWSESAPFQISDAADDDAHWYYLTLDPTQTPLVPAYNSEATSNVECSTSARELGNTNQEWAFVGNPYTGLLVYNRAAGSSMTLGTTANPASDGNTGGSTRAVLLASPTYGSWIPQASTYGTNGFYMFLKIDDNTKYGANNRDSQLAFWTDGYGAGSTFTVEEVVDDYSDYVKSDVKPYFDATGKYFGLTATAAVNKAAVYSAALESCTKETYLELLAYVQDAANIRFPATGYYRIKSSGSRAVGESYIAYGKTNGSSYTGLITKPAATATDPSTIFHFTKLDNGKYTMTIQGLNVQGATQSTIVQPNSNTAAEFTFTPVSAGLTTITASGDTYTFFHESGWTESGYNYNAVLGWTSESDASHWIIEDAKTFTGTLTDATDDTDEGHSYASLCVPFEISGITGASAYTPTLDGKTLDMGDGAATVEAGTPVVLIGESGAGSYTATINNAVAPATAVANATLSGTFTGTSLDCTAATGTTYVLGFDADNNNRIGFYHVNNTAFALGANRVYIELDNSGNSNGFAIALSDNDDLTAIESQSLKVAESQSVYDLQGRRVADPQKGQLYIINGKKVLY